LKASKSARRRSSPSPSPSSAADRKGKLTDDDDDESQQTGIVQLFPSDFPLSGRGLSVGAPQERSIRTCFGRCANGLFFKNTPLAISEVRSLLSFWLLSTMHLHIFFCEREGGWGRLAREAFLPIDVR